MFVWYCSPACLCLQQRKTGTAHTHFTPLHSSARGIHLQRPLCSANVWSACVCLRTAKTSLNGLPAFLRSPASRRRRSFHPLVRRHNSHASAFGSCNFTPPFAQCAPSQSGTQTHAQTQTQTQTQTDAHARFSSSPFAVSVR